MVENLTVEEVLIKKAILTYYSSIGNVILYTCFFIEFFWFPMFLYRIIKKDSNFISAYYIILLIGYFPNILAVGIFIPTETLRANFDVKIPEPVAIIYGVIRWYNYRLIGPWNTILAFNRFTGMFLYKKHDSLWSGFSIKIIIAILLIYPFILGIHLLQHYRCLSPSYADEHYICLSFYDSMVSYSNLANAGISLILGISTAFARKLKGQKWAKKQKFETYLLVQLIISTTFLCISETATLINAFVQETNSFKLFTTLNDFIIKAILVSATNWIGQIYHCSSAILIICLSKQIRESFITFYRLYFIPGIKNPTKSVTLLSTNSLTKTV